MNKSQIVSILTCVVSCAGTAATAVMAVKDSKRKLELPEPQNRKSKIKNNIKRYWRTYLLGGLTMSSNIIGCTFSVKSIGTLTASVAGLSATCRQLKDKMTDEQKEQLMHEMADKITEVKSGRELYTSEYTGIFAARPEDVAMAYKKLNDILNDPREIGRVYIKDFLKWCNAELYDECDFLPYKDFGWDWGYLNDTFDKDFVKMVEIHEGMDVGKVDEYNNIHNIKVNILQFSETPIYLDDSTEGIDARYNG